MQENVQNWNCASRHQWASRYFSLSLTSQIIDASELWCWRRLLRVPWPARRSNKTILKEISPEYSLEGLILKLKLQYFGHLMWRTDSFWKDPDAAKDGRQEEKGTTEDEMAGWNHWLNGVSLSKLWEYGQGDLVCCSPCGYKESDTTERLNWTESKINTSVSANWRKHTM